MLCLPQPKSGHNGRPGWAALPVSSTALRDPCLNYHIPFLRRQPQTTPRLPTMVPLTPSLNLSLSTPPLLARFPICPLRSHGREASTATLSHQPSEPPRHTLHLLRTSLNLFQGSRCQALHSRNLNLSLRSTCRFNFLSCLHSIIRSVPSVR